ncbi:MAG: lasso RiPP family leader peptide-containing protein [Gammaproteobacteria bacterium]
MKNDEKNFYTDETNRITKVNSEGIVRKFWQRPVLTELGDINKVTRGEGPGITDSGQLSGLLFS